MNNALLAPPNAFYNVEAEKSLIGLALQDAPKYLKLIAEVPTDLFYDQRNQTIHRGLLDLLKSETPVDMITVDDWLGKHGLLEGIGGTAYLMECMDIGFMPSQAEHYLRIVRECAMRRQLYTIGKELMEKAGSPDSADDVRDWAARTLRDVRSGEMTRLISMRDAVLNTYVQIDSNQQREGEPNKRILSGIATLDNKLGGLSGGEYVAIGARPSVGKSILALTFCVNAAKAGKRVLLSSLEMNEIEITERVLASQGDVSMRTITSSNIPQDAWDGIAQTVNRITDLPLWYTLDSYTVESLRRAAYQLYENGGLDLIAVDYLQLMESTYAKRQSRQEQVSEISRGLKKLAAELKIPILVLTQLNRASVSDRIDGKKARREPTMADARESGAIEQDANIFILLHDPQRDEMRDDMERETWDNLDKQKMSMIRLIIDKNRQGKRGRLTVAFDGDHMRFLPITRKDV